VSLDRDILVSALRNVSGRHYDTSTGASRRKNNTDCSRFAFAVLVDVYGARVKDEHNALHITDGAHPFSNVEAIVRLGIGEEVDEPLPGRWHYFQGWKSLDPLASGHTTLFYAAPTPFVGESLVLQATPLDAPWCDFRSWEDHAKRWRFVRLAVLTES